MTLGKEIHDPWVHVDGLPDPGRLMPLVEERGADSDQAEMRRRFRDWVGLAPGGAVLEVGCGTGVWTRELAALAGPGGRVLGVDPSRFLVQEARRLACERCAPPHPSFEVADGAALPFPDESWDLVLAATVLGHTHDPAAVLREMVRVARRGGRVAIFDHDWESFLLNHSDKELTRCILNFTCDRREADGWIGRRILGMMRQAGLGGTRCLPLAWVDAEYGGYMRHALKSRAEFAAQHGAVTETKAKAWVGEFEARAREGTFFAAITYFGFAGTR